MRIEKFLEYYSSGYKIIPTKNNNYITIRWIDRDNKKHKEVGVMDVYIEGDAVKITGYRKYVKDVNGYKFIKMCIDYLLESGYSTISSNNRSEDAAKVWEKLKKEYKVVTEAPVGLVSNPGYNPKRHDRYTLSKN